MISGPQQAQVFRCLILALIAGAQPWVHAAQPVDKVKVNGNGKWTDSASWQGGGTPNNAGGTTFNAQITTGTVELDANVTVESVLIDTTGGIITSVTGTPSKKLTVQSKGSSWKSGSLLGNNGAGELVISSTGDQTTPDLTITTMSGKTLDNWTLRNSGAVLWEGGHLSTGNGAAVVNQTGAVFSTSFDGALNYDLGGGRPTFSNAGTFEKTAGSGGATQIQAYFDNAGTVQVRSGKLQLAGGGRGTATSTFVVAAGGQIEISSDLELAAGAQFKGDGIGRVVGGTLLANGTIEISNLAFQGGALAGSNVFAGTVDWVGGHWNSPGAPTTTQIASGGVLNLSHPGTHEFNRRSITNAGVVNWSAGNLRGGSGSVFVNNSVFNDLGGTKTIAAPGGFGGTFSFINNGSYQKTVGGTTTVEVPFTNNGYLRIAAGSLVFASTFVNSGQIALANGADAQFSAPLLLGASTPLSGAGTIRATNVTAGGVVDPGASPGTLNITGDLTLLSTSSLLIEIAGPIQGVSYDLLNVTGSGTLAGNLALSFLNGYQASVNSSDTFTIMTSGSVLSGAFANINPGQRLFTIDGAGSFQVNYGMTSVFSPNNIVLSNFAIAVPEPSTWITLGLGSGLVAFFLRRRK